MAEQINQILDTAEKIVKELEVLQKGKQRGKLSQDTEKDLLTRLYRLSNSLISILPTKLVEKAEKEKVSEAVKLAHQTLKDIKKRIGDERRERKRKKRKHEVIELRKPTAYVTLANSLFYRFARNLTKKGYFKDIALDIKKANLNILLDSFVAVIFLNTFLGALAGLLIAFAVSFLAVTFTPIPLISISAFNILRFISTVLLLPLIGGLAMLLISYFYPKLEANSRIGRINDELPFAIMHMSAIVGSGVEPSKVFTLISETPEYKTFNVETKRVVNKINFYGHDLLTAVKETADLTPSQSAKDLFNGMASIIATGGDLKRYLEKKASSLMVDYKLKRRKFAQTAGIYADMYTGLLITAPIIFGVLLTMITPLGGNLLGMSAESLAIFGLVAIVLVNVGFIIFLSAIQPAE